LIEDRPGLTRELPAWMCDAAACRAMTLGSPVVRLDALHELSTVLADLARETADGASLGSPKQEEAHDEATDGAPANTTRAEPGARRL